MSKKRVFQKLDQMNLEDIENGTSNVSISPHFISANLTKQGTVVTMGADHGLSQALLENKKMVILVTIDKKEWKKREQ